MIRGMVDAVKEMPRDSFGFSRVKIMISAKLTIGRIEVSNKA